LAEQNIETRLSEAAVDHIADAGFDPGMVDRHSNDQYRSVWKILYPLSFLTEKY
jgi:hypothetical protein